jgi:CheY-like chemotaxis protein
MYAAVDESTPPDIATAIFTLDANSESNRLLPPGHSSCMTGSGLIQTDIEDRAGKTCVLVVDDDPSIRKMIIAALRREGYSFIEAPNGKDALDAMRSDRPDVVVLDLMMPVMSGWDVLRERSADPELTNIPIIVISASRSPEIAVAMDKGICAFLPKPFDIGALSSLVRSCVASDFS